MCERRGSYRFWWRKLREGDNLEDSGIGGKIILNGYLRNGMGRGGGMDWIDLSEFRDRWHALVNAVMNLRIPKNVGSFS
jgi:hypothetical protein